MATPEQMLISKIILTDGGMKQAVEWGITREDFRAMDVQSVWDQLYADYTSPQHPGSAMGANMALIKFPQLNLNDVDPNIHLDHLCLEVRKTRMGSFLMEQAAMLQEAAERDPVIACGMLQDLAHRTKSMDLGRKTDVNFFLGMQKVVDRYEKVKRGGLTGKISWPWSPIQEATGGIQHEDYVVLYGRPKSKKTWVLTFLIYWAYISGARILFYTKEMTDENLFMRVASFILNTVYDDLRLGRMTETQEESLRSLLAAAKSVEDQMICLSAKDADGRDTVAWLHGKIEKYKPDIVFIDGMYLMSTESRRPLRDNERVQAISRAIRSMNLALKVPVICTVQANRKAAGHQEANLDEIAFSDALSQDCTMAIRVIKDKDQPTISLVLGGNTREFDLPGFRIYGVPCTQFGYHSPLSSAEALQVQEQDVDVAEATAKTEAEPKKKGKRGRPSKDQQDAFARELDRHLKELPR